MKTTAQISSTIFLIGILVSLLVSCAGTPRRYLAVDASLVKQGESEAEVLKLLGPPKAARKKLTGQEEWYYYVVHRHFWQHLPILGHYLRGKRIEALQITIDSGQVVKAVYYVQRI